MLLVAVVAAAAMPVAQAQSTWLGGGSDADWGTSGNWSTTLNNNFNSALVFAGSTKTSNTNTLTGGTATSITFSAGASPFTISGSAIRLSGNITNSSTSLQTINTDLVLTANRTVSMTTGGGNVTIGGNISGAFKLTASGTGALTLTGSNSYSGGTQGGATSATFVVGSNNALGTGLLTWQVNNNLDVTSGGSFVLPSTVGILWNATAAPFLGSGNGSLEFTGTTTFGSTTARGANVSAGTLTLGTVAGANTITTFTKNGSGTLVLKGPVSTIAGLSVTAGTMLVNNTFSSLTSGTVNAAATFGGSGTVSAGSLAMNGTLTPGSTGVNTGLLSLSDLTLGSTGRTVIDITGASRGSAYDAVNVTNNLVYSGTLSFLMPTIAAGTYNIFDFATISGSFSTVSGTFGGSLFTFTGPASGVFTADLGSGTTATFTQSTGELVIVPEPTTVVLAGLGVGMAGFSLWRRRRIAAIGRRL